MHRQHSQNLSAKPPALPAATPTIRKANSFKPSRSSSITGTQSPTESTYLAFQELTLYSENIEHLPPSRRFPYVPDGGSCDSSDSCVIRSPLSLCRSFSSTPSSPRSFATLTAPSPRLPVRMGHNVPHHFEPKRFMKPDQCRYCYETLWAKRGCQCLHCGYACHAECAYYVPAKCGLSSELESYGSILSMFTENEASIEGITPEPLEISTPRGYKRSGSFTSLRVFMRPSNSSPTCSRKSKRRATGIDFSMFRSPSSTSSLKSLSRDSKVTVPPSPTHSIFSLRRRKSQLSMVTTAENPTPTKVEQPRFTKLTSSTLSFKSHRSSPVTSLHSRITSPTTPRSFKPYYYQDRECEPSPHLSPNIVRAPIRSPTAAAQYDYPGHQFKRDSGSYSLFSNESDIEIELDELAFHERIGSGSFGEVWQGYWHGNCAIKILKLADPTEEQINTWRNEVEILRHTRHERILLFMGVCAQPPKLALVTALCENGSLYKHIHVLGTPIGLQLLLRIATQIAEGMEYLHARGLLHNDLKSHNILLNKDFDAKIADFGLSMLKRDNRLAKGVQGSAHWLAPEIVRMADRDTPYSEKSDVWAFGMILYELIASRLPYSDLVGEQILWQIGSQKLPSMDEVREDTPADLKQLMANCWELRPQDRKSFDVILQNLVHMQTKLNFSMRRTQSLQNVRDRSWSLGSNSPEHKMDDLSTGSDSDYTKYWIDWFLNTKGNEYFCEVDEEYILDRFNLTGLNTEVREYQQALDLITDSLEDDLDDEMREQVEKSARHLYGLIHARFIITSRGLAKMLEKYKKADFGRCPRVLCQNQPLFPVGLSDVSYTKTVKLYCPRCEDIYNPKSSRHAAIDGAYFGSSFPHMLFQVYPNLVPAKGTDRYVPRIFGFKIHEIAKQHRWQDAMRGEMEKMWRDRNASDRQLGNGEGSDQQKGGFFWVA